MAKEKTALLSTMGEQSPSVSRVSAVALRLRDFAHEAGANAKLPTVRELCRRLDTSITTLDAALAQLEAQDVVCRRQGSGIFVSPHLGRRSIAVLLGSGMFRKRGVSPVWGMLWGLCASEAQRRMETRNEHYDFQIVNTEAGGVPGLVDGLTAKIDGGLLHGALMIGLPPNKMAWEELRHLPLVSFAGPGHWSVGIADQAHVEQGVSYLASLGCRRVGLWNACDFRREVPEPGRPPSPDYARLYRRGLAEFLRLCADAGIEGDPSLVCNGLTMHQEYARDPARYEALCRMHHQDQGYDYALRVFSGPAAQRPDGLVILDDMMTLGVLTALESLGLRPGRDVHLCSHSNAESIVLYRREDQIARLEVDPAAIVQAMFALLDDLLAGRAPEQRQRRVPTRFYPPTGQGSKKGRR